MGKLDPGLKLLVRSSNERRRTMADDSAFTLEAAPGVPARANVLAQFTGPVGALEAAGLRVRTRAGDVIAGEIDVDRVEALGAVPGLVRIEVSRVLGRELDAAVPEARVTAVHTGPPSHRGAGVIVGIIDSGIHYEHAAFRNADGTSRILAIWDQGLSPAAGEQHPAAFSYGVEYRKAEIDLALASGNPLSTVRHLDIQIPNDGFHGTHVAGIAAGNGGGAGQGQPAFTFVGVAPDADIVVVANTRGRAAGERGLGDSADSLDAVQYIFNVAAAEGRPVVINQSQGDNVGPHDGTSLLEQGIDNLLTGAGRVLVKSAGNEGARNRHASGQLNAGATQTVRFSVPNFTSQVVVDIWYDGADRIDISIDPPGSAAAGPVVSPGNTATQTLANGNEAFIDTDLDDPGNSDNRIFVDLSPGSETQVQTGLWALRLTATTATPAPWNAWIQRNSGSQFRPPFVNEERTISIPGTAPGVITVGSYVTRGSSIGGLSAFSSRGPTRDGRQAPTVAAPGEVLMAPQPASTGDLYGLMQGTSMAAPMVTGVVALMLERNATLTAADVRARLMNTARHDGFTGAAAGNDWGAGKLDADAAFQSA
jgi:subtilisin family serine protease